MPDFRADLYRRYVSTFKKEDLERLAEADSSYFRYCDYKYRPIFDVLPRSAAILELGCGSGRMMRYLHSLGFSKVKGVDLSNEQIELALVSGLDAEAGDIFEFLKTNRDPYDAVVAIDCLEHFTKDELMALAPLIHGTLNPGGILVIQTPNGEGLFCRQVIYGDLTHCTVLTPSSLQQLLSLTDFGEFRFFETGPVPGKLSGLARVALWGGLKALANCVRMIEAHKHQSLWTENMICVCSRSQSPLG